MTFFVLFVLSAFQVLPAVIGMPHVPETVRNPLMEIVIPCMAEGYLARNAGMLPGLPGMFSVIPGMIVVGFILLAAMRIIKSEANPGEYKGGRLYRCVVYSWALVVVCFLGFTVTVPEQMIHAYRWRLLCHAGWTLQSPELMKASEREAALAGDLLKPYRP